MFRCQEQELLASGDPQYAHYGGPLHVKVETIAPAHVAYQRIAGVLDILSKTLVPVSSLRLVFGCGTLYDPKVY